MLRSFRFFTAIVAACALAIPLAGCQGGEQKADRQEKSKTKVARVEEQPPAEETVEDSGIEPGDPNAEPSDVVLWYVNAVKGDPNAWDIYNPDIPVYNALLRDQEDELETLTSLLDRPPTAAEEEQLNKAINDAYDRVVVKVESEEIDGETAKLVVAIWGFDQMKGILAAPEDPVVSEAIQEALGRGEDLMEAAPIMTVRQWELAPSVTEPVLLPIEMVYNPDTERWGFGDSDEIFTSLDLKLAFANYTDLLDDH